VNRYRVRVRVMPRASLLDPQGQTVERALGALGFGGVGSVRIGKSLDLVLEADSSEAARRDATAMCEKLLANPVTEDFALDGVEAAE
jgi:phosphoribosylformylglycinamidine synthase